MSRNKTSRGGGSSSVRGTPNKSTNLGNISEVMSSLENFSEKAPDSSRLSTGTPQTPKSARPQRRESVGIFFLCSNFTEHVFKYFIIICNHNHS
jgi:hypothetical protein